MCLVFASGWFLIAGAQAATVPNQRLAFDHETTGFALTGQHEFVSCEACHVGGVFKGTPKQCTGCHTGVIALGKSANHIPTSAACDACHSVAVSFNKSVVMNHSTITTACVTCHNSTLASGMAGKHKLGLHTTNECQLCHKTSPAKWAPAFTFDHSQMKPVVACASCHDGTGKLASKGKGPGHIITSLPCDSCHTTSAWTPAGVDHSAITTNCISCHDGQRASGMSGKHSLGLHTSNQCEQCHSKSPGKWKPIIKFDHGQMVPANAACESCHNNTLAQGKGPSHIATTFTCSNCHNTTAWRPATAIDHSTFANNCITCHDGTAATGKSGKHSSGLSTSDACDKCHNKAPLTWKPITKFDHAQTSVTVCSTCHNGTLASTKSASHIASTNDCAKCHNSTAVWTVVATLVDHTQVIPSSGSCANCHVSGNANNVKTFKSLNHPPTSNNCSVCHDVAPATWLTYKSPLDHREVIGTCAVAGCHVAPTTGQTKSATHPATTNRCELCHVVGTGAVPNPWLNYKKPIDHSQILGSCATCHNGTAATGKTPAHIPSTDNCMACHAVSPTPWKPAQKVDHKEVAGACVDCHVQSNTFNVKTFKLPVHPSTNDKCADCHSVAPAKWTPILKMNHADTSAACNACHDGSSATPKGANHIKTSINCTACHNTTAWLPYTKVDHNEVLGTCNSCHNGTSVNGVLITGLSTNHIKIGSQTCDICHDTVAWKPTHFAHTATQIGTNTCVKCHDGQAARGKAFAHIRTTDDCTYCHKYNVGSNWAPIPYVNHTYVVPNTTTGCATCHVSGTVNVTTYKLAVHPGTTNNCAACHSVAPTPWTPARFVDHNEVLGLNSCANTGCHATTKLATHMPTNNLCADCHSVPPATWKPAKTVNHSDVVGACSTCHISGNKFGSYVVRSRLPTHLPSTNSCDNCHDAPPGGAGWKVIIVDHTQVMPSSGGCSTSCHVIGNPYGATYQSTSHPKTDTVCEACHSKGPPGVWVPALRVDHNHVLGTCSSCHKVGGSAMPPPATGHFSSTGLECDACHNKTLPTFSPQTYPKHTSTLFYSRHWFGDNACQTCHKQNSADITGVPNTFTQCGACHSGDYVQSKHGTTTVTANTNCGKCHSVSKTNWKGA